MWASSPRDTPVSCAETIFALHLPNFFDDPFYFSTLQLSGLPLLASDVSIACLLSTEACSIYGELHPRAF